MKYVVLLIIIFVQIGPKKKNRQISANILEKIRGRVMVCYATFNNISVILWRSVLSVEETGVPGENHRQSLSHNVVHMYLVHHERGSNS